MKILLIHNSYSTFSGEEAVFAAQEKLLRAGGHDVETYERGSAELKAMPMGKAQGFFTGLYSRRSVREVRELVRGKSAVGSRQSAVDSRQSPVHSQQLAVGIQNTADWRPPEIVHIHNLYPLISPAILPVIKSTRQIFKSSNLQIFKSSNRQITSSPVHSIASSPPKIVMTVHNYRLVCPNGLFFTHGEICERCAGGREWNCITRNCEGSLFKSSGYAMRNLWARKRRYYLDNVDAFLCLTAFQKGKLVENGFPEAKCHVLPNFLEKKKEERQGEGAFVFWAGRINAQKGFDILSQAASLLPGIPFRVAGSDSTGFSDSCPPPGNIHPTGKLSKEEMERSFGEAAFLVFTSRSYEGFPMVFLEAMAAGIPVIAPRLAGFPEIIEDGINGLLFRPGDAADLASKTDILWKDKDLRTRLGENGRKKLEEQYSPEVYYRKLMEVYKA